MKFNKKEIYYIITILCLALFFFMFKLWSFTLFDVDEPRYAEAAREMIESNNWITPYFNYVVRFDKPVFFYWLIAISYKVFGVSEFAARLPSAIMATLIVFSVFFFGRRFINANFGFLSALVTLTSIEVIGLARMSITDMTLAAFLTFMLLAGFTAAHSDEPQKKYWWYAFFAFMGLAALTKGPIAMAIAVIVLWPYFLLTGQFVQVFKTCRLLKGILIFFLVAAPWYALVILENGWPYIEQFFLTDNFKRFTATVSGHKAPIYFFVVVVIVGFLPWTTFLPYALYKHFKPIMLAYKEFFSKKKSEECSLEDNKCAEKPFFCPFVRFFKFLISPLVANYKDAPIEKQLSLFSFVWFILILVFFSLSGTKLLTYILPLFPALGLMMGMLWYDFINKPEKNDDKAMIISSGVLVFVFTVVSYIFIFHFNSLMPRDAKVLNLGNIKIYAALVFVIGTSASFVFLLLKQRLRSFYSIVVMMVFVAIIAFYGVLPKVNYAAQGHLNRLIAISQNYDNAKNQIITYGLIKPSIVFYTKRQLLHFETEDNEEFKKHLDKDERIFIITRVRFLDELSNFSNVYIIDKGRRFALVTNKKIDKKIKQLLEKG